MVLAHATLMGYSAPVHGVSSVFSQNLPLKFSIALVSTLVILSITETVG